MLAVAAYSDLDQIRGLRELWGDLAAASREASWTRSFDWFEAAAASGRGEPRVFVAAAAGKAVGLWPMFLRTEAGAFGRIRVLTGGDADAPWLGPLGPHPTATAAIVARHLRAAGGDWDELSVAEPVAAGGPSRIATALAAAGLGPREEPAADLAEVELSGRWTDVLATCDEPTRLDIYRAVHASGRSGDGFSFHRRRGGDVRSLLALLDEVGEVAAAGRCWGRKHGWSGPIAAAAQQGAADVAILRFGGRPVAAAAGYVLGAATENALMAVAADAPRLAAGRLVCDLLRDGLARGDRRFRFVATTDHPASGWATTRRPRRASRVAAERPAVRLKRLGRSIERFVARHRAATAAGV